LFCQRKDLNLQVHHVVYRRKVEPWDYPDYLYQTACEPCHESRQAVTDKIVDAVRIALMNIPTERLGVSARRLCAEAMLEIEPALDPAAVPVPAPSVPKYRSRGSVNVHDVSMTSKKEGK
jgi:hypothetical protein